MPTNVYSSSRASSGARRQIRRRPGLIWMKVPKVDPTIEETDEMPIDDMTIGPIWINVPPKAAKYCREHKLYL